MPPTSPAGEEVVEKKASAPVSTACLIIACAALLGGIIFQVLEIADYRSGPGDPKDLAAKKYKTDLKKLKDAVEETLSKAAVGAAPEDAAPGGAAPPPADDPDDAGGDAKAEPAGAEPGEDAPADGAPAADEEK
jgi:hypothetical protein